MPTRNADSIAFKAVTVGEVLKIIDNLSTKKAVGYDSIPSCILKWSSAVISPKLAKLINLCVKSGVYPDILKTARVTTLHKGGEKSNADNYRPISVLTQLNKVFEKVIHGQLTTFIQNQKILSNTQFGFRSGHSTAHGISHLNEKLINSLEQKKVAAVLFIDLKSAFDTVNHKILLKKLDNYGIHGSFLKLLESYLTNRQQFIKCGDRVCPA